MIPTLMFSELFSASIKEKASCVLVGFFGISVFLSTTVFQVSMQYLGLYGPFTIYGIICLLSTFLSIRWLPETKGKTLEEIQQEFKK